MSTNGKKKFKRILNCVFGGRRKVQITKFAFDCIIVITVIYAGKKPNKSSYQYRGLFRRVILFKF